MRGFLVGSLALIALYVAVQDGTGDKAKQASGILVTMAKRLMSAEAAGIPDKSKSKDKTPPPGGTPGGSGQSGFAPLPNTGSGGGSGGGGGSSW